MASVEHNYNVNTRGSKLSYLTSGTAAGGVHYLKGGVKSPAEVLAAGNATDVTGIVFPIGLGNAGGEPFSDSTVKNQIGDPQEKNYTLTASDFIATNGAEKHGGAQKFVNAVLDGAFVAYDSGVKQGSGLSSMTVSRGDLTLNNSKVTGISGVVNTYSRSYSVTFQYKQSGMLSAGNTAALPDITNDLSTEAGDGPF
tara:strand:- start:445 stop:1035 length:591 start_codon:yes stop_codon:yes gene_type:complete